MHNLFLAWQDQQTRRWHTIGRLSKREKEYEFVFTKGAAALRTVPRDLLRMEPGKRYLSSELMPVFKNRLLNPSRADFRKIADWVGIEDNDDEFKKLEKFGRVAGIDALMVYPEPIISGETYSVDFLVHGMRHLPANIMDRCKLISEGDVLTPILDVQNPVDLNAVGLKEKDWNIIIGYVPAFYANDLYRILRNSTLAMTAKINVVKNNKDAPIQLRMLCRFTSNVDPGFSQFQTTEHEPFIF